MSATDSIQFKLYIGRTGFAQLATAWTELALARGFHFLHLPVWYEAELEHCRNCSDVIFAAGYVHGELNVVVPLVKTRLRKGRISLPILELFYPNEMGVNDILAVDSTVNWLPVLTAALRAGLTYFWLIRWQCVPQSGCANGLTKRPDIRYTHESKYLDISGGVESFWRNYSTKFTKGLRKKNAKAEQAGTLSLQCVTDSGALPEAFEHFLEVEGSGWKGAQGTSIIQQPDKLAYYRKLLEGASELGMCQINLLWLGSSVIAAQFGILIDKTLYLLKIGFREEYGSISPGYLILEQLINRYAGSETVRMISFVTGVNWIDRWHPHVESVGTCYTGNGTLPGALALKVIGKLLKNKTAKSLPATANQDDSE